MCIVDQEIESIRCVFEYIDIYRNDTEKYTYQVENEPVCALATKAKRGATVSAVSLNVLP